MAEVAAYPREVPAGAADVQNRQWRTAMQVEQFREAQLLGGPPYDIEVLGVREPLVTIAKDRQRFVMQPCEDRLDRLHGRMLVAQIKAQRGEAIIDRRLIKPREVLSGILSGRLRGTARA